MSQESGENLIEICPPRANLGPNFIPDGPIVTKVQKFLVEIFKFSNGRYSHIQSLSAVIWFRSIVVSVLRKTESFSYQNLEQTSEKNGNKCCRNNRFTFTSTCCVFHVKTGFENFFLKGNQILAKYFFEIIQKLSSLFKSSTCSHPGGFFE